MYVLSDHFSNYAVYHQDGCNIVTHLVGIPAIVLAVVVSLSWPVLADLSGVAVTLALLMLVLATLFYLRLGAMFGVVMPVLITVCVWVGNHVVARSTAAWLSVGIGLFVIGWIIQFVGHYYEGRKSTFVDDLAGLVIGPSSLVAETAFALGLRAKLCDKVVNRSHAMRAAIAVKYVTARAASPRLFLVSIQTSRPVEKSTCDSVCRPVPPRADCPCRSAGLTRPTRLAE